MNFYILLFLTGFFASMTVLTSIQVFGQEIKDNVAEDEIIVCVNGNIIEMSGNICKVYSVDDGYWGYNPTIDEIQGDLYKNPESDTFNMDVRD